MYIYIIGTGCRVQVLAWSSIAQSVCQRAFSLLAIWCLGPGFESCIQQRKTTCLLSIQISLARARASKLTTTNMYTYMYIHTYIFCCNFNIWVVNSALAKASIFDSGTDVLEKVLKFWRQKLSQPRWDFKPQPLDSCQMPYHLSYQGLKDKLIYIAKKCDIYSSKLILDTSTHHMRTVWYFWYNSNVVICLSVANIQQLCCFNSLRPSDTKMIVDDSSLVWIMACYLFGATLLSKTMLTHWGWDKMAAIFQTTFSNGFSWMKMHEFRLIFHWSLFLGVQLTIFQHWFR